MKKIIYIFILLLGSSALAIAAEKRDCSEIKKLSREYMACKTGNLKASVLNQKNKKQEKQIDNSSAKVKTKKAPSEKTIKLKKIKNKASNASQKFNAGVKNKAVNIKKKFSGFFKNSKKQYPKGVKK
jgi:hypothetical protein